MKQIICVSLKDVSGPKRGLIEYILTYSYVFMFMLLRSIRDVG